MYVKLKSLFDREIRVYYVTQVLKRCKRVFKYKGLVLTTHSK